MANPALTPGAVLLLAAMKRQHRKALAEAAVELQGIWKEVLSQPGKGEPYVRYNPKRKGRASRPGDPPAPDQGLLRASISIEDHADSFRVGPAGPPGRYGRALEYGTDKMDPRPHARPAKRIAEHQMTDAIVFTLRTG